nr:zinc finger, CCHC-type [Tanacetum cinerariifolium]
MGDENPIRTLGDYSKPSHEGYKNTIDLPVEKNVVPLRSDTIRLVQNRCSFHGILPEDPNQHLKDFLKLVDSLDLDGDNMERMRLLVPMTLIIAWKTLNKPLLTTHPYVPGEAGSKWYIFKPELNNLDENPLCTLGDYFNPSHEGYKNTIDLHIGNNVVPLRSDTIWLVQNGCLFHRVLSKDPNQYLTDFLKLVDSLDLDASGKLHDLNAKESWELLEDLALYHKESWNDPWDFAKLVKAIPLPQDVPSTSDRRLIKLKTQV